MQERQPVGTDRTSGLLTADQVQALLDIDRSTVYRMASDGRLPAVKIGRQWRFPADRIRHLLEAGLPSDPVASSQPTIAAPRSETPPTALAAEILEPVLDVAAEVLGVMMVVTDMAGQPVSHIANPAPRMVAAAEDPEAIAACAAEWRAMADDVDFEPRFRLGPLSFECARAFIRNGHNLVGMVLAGGIAPAGSHPADLYDLSAEQRRQVLASLPKVAAALSRAAARAADPGRATDAVLPDRRSDR